jgi:replicative DNA helicase
VLGSADFFLPAHGTLWNATCALFAKSAPVDAVTLAEELSRREQLEGIGGPAYLSSRSSGTKQHCVGRFTRPRSS